MCEAIAAGQDRRARLAALQCTPVDLSKREDDCGNYTRTPLAHVLAADVHLTSIVFVARFLLSYLQHKPPSDEAAVPARALAALQHVSSINQLLRDVTRSPGMHDLATYLARLPHNLMTFFSAHPPADADAVPDAARAALEAFTTQTPAMTEVLRMPEVSQMALTLARLQRVARAIADLIQKGPIRTIVEAARWQEKRFLKIGSMWCKVLWDLVETAGPTYHAKVSVGCHGDDPTTKGIELTNANHINLVMPTRNALSAAAYDELYTVLMRKFGRLYTRTHEYVQHQNGDAAPPEVVWLQI
jgi:hypothetical protein